MTLASVAAELILCRQMTQIHANDGKDKLHLCKSAKSADNLL